MSGRMTAESEELQALRERASELEVELEELRRAHDAQARHLVAERLALAREIENEVDVLRKEIAWRKEVMGEQEKLLETLKNSRSLRYTAPLRRVVHVLRRN